MRRRLLRSLLAVHSSGPPASPLLQPAPPLLHPSIHHAHPPAPSNFSRHAGSNAEQGNRGTAAAPSPSPSPSRSPAAAPDTTEPQRRLNQSLSGSRSLPELLSVVQEHLSRRDLWSPINISTVFNRVARAQRMLPADVQRAVLAEGSRSRIAFDALSDRARQLAPSFPSEALVVTLTAWAKLGYWPGREAVAPLFDRCRELIAAEKMEGKGLALVLYAMATLGSSPVDLIEEIQAALKTRTAALSPQDISQAAWALANLRSSDFALQEALRDRAVEAWPHYNNQDAAQLIWGLAHLQTDPGRLWDLFHSTRIFPARATGEEAQAAQAAQAAQGGGDRTMVPGLKPSELSLLLSAIEKTKRIRSLQQASSSSTPSSSAASAAAAAATVDEIVQALTDQFCRGLASASSSDIHRVANVLARLAFNPGQEPLAAMAARLTTLAERSIGASGRGLVSSPRRAATGDAGGAGGSVGVAGSSPFFPLPSSIYAVDALKRAGLQVAAEGHEVDRLCRTVDSVVRLGLPALDSTDVIVAMNALDALGHYPVETLRALSETAPRRLRASSAAGAAGAAPQEAAGELQVASGRGPAEPASWFDTRMAKPSDADKILWYSYWRYRYDLGAEAVRQLSSAAVRGWRSQTRGDPKSRSRVANAILVSGHRGGAEFEEAAARLLSDAAQVAEDPINAVAVLRCLALQGQCSPELWKAAVFGSLSSSIDDACVAQSAANRDFGGRQRDPAALSDIHLAWIVGIAPLILQQQQAAAAGGAAAKVGLDSVLPLLPAPLVAWASIPSGPVPVRHLFATPKVLQPLPPAAVESQDIKKTALAAASAASAASAAAVAAAAAQRRQGPMQPPQPVQPLAKSLDEAIGATLLSDTLGALITSRVAAARIPGVRTPDKALAVGRVAVAWPDIEIELAAATPGAAPKRVAILVYDAAAGGLRGPWGPEAKPRGAEAAREALVRAMGYVPVTVDSGKMTAACRDSAHFAAFIRSATARV